jgi:hypothetical protein
MRMWTVIMMVVATAAVSQGAFVVNGTVQTAPGTYSWGSPTALAYWTGYDATHPSGNIADDKMFDNVRDYWNPNVDGALACNALTWAPIEPLIGIYNFGSAYHVTSIELFQGPNNTWWSNPQVDVSTSADGISYNFVGTVAAGANWGGTSDTMYRLFNVNADAQYVKVVVNYPGYVNDALDEVNVNVTPEPMTLALLSVGGLFIARRKKA